MPIEVVSCLLQILEQNVESGERHRLECLPGLAGAHLAAVNTLNAIVVTRATISLVLAALALALAPVRALVLVPTALALALARATVVLVWVECKSRQPRA